MSNKVTYKIDGFFEYVVPPLEGLCVQCLHLGSYDDEPTTNNLMHEYIKENGYELDITDERYHHEIYLSDQKNVM